MVFRTLALLLLAGAAQAAELEGVRLDERVHVDGQTLELNGMALRTRYFFKAYVAGLYLPARATSAERAIDGGGAKRIVLVMMREATAEQFCQSVEAGLAANHTADDANDACADLFRELQRHDEIGRHVFLQIAAADGEDEERVFLFQS